MELCNAGLQMAVVVVALAGVAMCAYGAAPEVPDAEQELLNTVDPWGLPFSDQLIRFEGHFAQSEDAPFAIGVTHDLVKVWPVKYWFRGQTTPADADAPLMARERWAAAGQTQAFQIVALPRMGAEEATYTISVDAPGAQMRVYREVFVTTSEGAAYPRYASARWPDPLLPETQVTVGGADCGVFWVDVQIPADAPAGTLHCAVSVSAGDSVAQAIVPIRVVPGLELDAKAYPFVAWFRRHKMTQEQYQDHCALVLEHHMVPIDALKGQWDPENPGKLDAMRAFLEAHGQRVFEVDSPRTMKERFDALYEHLKKMGWLSDTWVYSHDEPDAAMWREKNLPFMRMVREKYPGLQVYVASDWHENMHEGVDAWMTDISASGYDPEKHRTLHRPQLWHYYCHLPVRWQMRAPLVQAPNLQIDNPAVEARLAVWMSHYYGAHAVFIWSGNAYTFADDFWQTLTLSDKPSGFPYAGVHNGNGWVVYPSPEGGGTVPSVRLKLIRAGLEDIAIMRAARRLLQDSTVTGARARRLRRLLDPVPDVFVHPQYFDRTPDALLGKRRALLEFLSEQGGR